MISRSVPHSLQVSLRTAQPFSSFLTGNICITSQMGHGMATNSGYPLTVSFILFIGIGVVVYFTGIL